MKRATMAPDALHFVLAWADVERSRVGGKGTADAAVSQVRSLCALARLVARFVREDPDRPGDLQWGHRILDDGADAGMDPGAFALAADQELRNLATLSTPPARRAKRTTR